MARRNNGRGGIPAVDLGWAYPHGPKGMCLPMGNVSMQFNLRVNSNAGLQLAPYQFLKGMGHNGNGGAQQSCSSPLANVAREGAGNQDADLADLAVTSSRHHAATMVIMIAQHTNTTFTALPLAAQQAQVH